MWWPDGKGESLRSIPLRHDLSRLKSLLFFFYWLDGWAVGFLVVKINRFIEKMLIDEVRESGNWKRIKQQRVKIKKLIASGLDDQRK
jgi:hypothetical protein